MNKHTRIWSLQEAKAKFSEVVKRAQTEGPADQLRFMAKQLS